MVASRRRVPFARLLVGFCVFLASTTQAAHQDLASLLVNQPGVAERARTFLLSNPLASLRTATFSLPSPSGVVIPRLPGPPDLSITGSIPRLSVRGRDDEDSEPREVNRSVKGDRLVPSRSIGTDAEAADGMIAIGEYRIHPDHYMAVLDVERDELRADNAGMIARNVDRIPNAGSVSRVSRLFFGSDDAELPPSLFQYRNIPEPQAKVASLPETKVALPPERPAATTAASVAAKGLVTQEEGQPKSPAERLGLAGSKRDKAEKCLAEAVYFESRGEPIRGQMAVAQVVINRVFSGFYPEDVCATVYQNAHRYLACQFTFACEGKKLVVNDADSWARAVRIARDMLDGKIWLAEVGKATHYHANWVRPDWIKEMRKLQSIGVHTFYRPRAWEG